MDDVAARVANRVQLTSDGHKAPADEMRNDELGIGLDRGPGPSVAICLAPVKLQI